MPSENIKALENYLSFCAAKNQVISKNIANVGTKNYKRQEVEFKDMLEDNINSGPKATNDKHFGAAKVKSNREFGIVEDNSEEMPSGVNNVDIDSEMAELAENSIKFKFAAKKIGGFYRDLQSVIKGGGRL